MTSRFKTIEEFFNATDFQELREQKRTLIRLQAYLAADSPETLDPKELDKINERAYQDIEGLLNFLDELQDFAADIFTDV